MKPQRSMNSTIYSVLYHIPGEEIITFHNCPFAPNVGEIVMHGDKRKEYVVNKRIWFSWVTPRNEVGLQCILFLKEYECGSLR